MARDAEVRDAVENALGLLQSMGYGCHTTVEDLVLWFQADTPYDEGFGLDQLIQNPLLVVHELVEIEHVKAMGLELTKDVIVKNMEKVDDAHLEATKVEIELAIHTRDIEHIKARMRHLSMWLEDSSVTPENKRKYRELREKTMLVLSEMGSGPGA